MWSFTANDATADAVTVWPDYEIKVAIFPSRVAQKVVAADITLIVDVFKPAQNVARYLDCFCQKNGQKQCDQML